MNPHSTNPVSHDISHDENALTPIVIYDSDSEPNYSPPLSPAESDASQQSQWAPLMAVSDFDADSDSSQPPIPPQPLLQVQNIGSDSGYDDEEDDDDQAVRWALAPLMRVSVEIDTDQEDWTRPRFGGFRPPTPPTNQRGQDEYNPIYISSTDSDSDE